MAARSRILYAPTTGEPRLIPDPNDVKPLISKGYTRTPPSNPRSPNAVVLDQEQSGVLELFNTWKQLNPSGTIVEFMASASAAASKIATPASNPTPAVPATAAPVPTPPTTATVTKVKINTADLAALQELRGVNVAIGTKLIAHRKDNPPFQNVEQLVASGIHPAGYAWTDIESQIDFATG